MTRVVVEYALPFKVKDNVYGSKGQGVELVALSTVECLTGISCEFAVLYHVICVDELSQEQAG